MPKQGKKKKDSDSSSIARNKRAMRDYFIDETFEAGIALSGCEVRSLRENHCQLNDCYVLVRGGEAFLHGLHISPYSHGGYNNPDPDRKRKLLLHKKQIRYLGDKVKVKGMAIVPISMYFSDKGMVKIEIGLARGKKEYDKRQAMAKRDAQREIDRAVKLNV